MASGSGQAASSDRGLTEDDLGELYDALYPMRKNYKPFGLLIGVIKTQIDNIEKQEADPGDRLLEILSVRVKQSEVLRWKDIDKALRSKSVGEGKVADDIREKYGRVFIEDQLEKRVQFEDQNPMRKNEGKSPAGETFSDELAKVESSGREVYTEKSVSQKRSLASQKVKTVSEKTGKSADIARQQFKLPRAERKLTKRAEVEKEKSTREERASDESDYQSDDSTNRKQHFPKGIETESENEYSSMETENTQFHRQARVKEEQECKGGIRKRRGQYSREAQSYFSKRVSKKLAHQFNKSKKVLLSPTFWLFSVVVACLSFAFLPFGIAYLVSLATLAISYSLLLAKDSDSDFSKVKEKTKQSGNLKRSSKLREDLAEEKDRPSVKEAAAVSSEKGIPASGSTQMESEDKESDLDDSIKDEEKSSNEEEGREPDDESSAVTSEEEGKTQPETRKRMKEKKRKIPTNKKQLLEKAPSQSDSPEQSDPDHGGGDHGVKKPRRRHKGTSSPVKHSSSSSTSPEISQRHPISRRKRKTKCNDQGHEGKEKGKKRKARGVSASETDDDSSPECDMSRNLSDDESKKLSKVFKRFFGRLCCEVANLAGLAAQLQQDNLISQETMIDVLRSPESEQEKTISLVSKLSKRIESRPYRLYRFIEVLLRNDALKEIGRDILKETGMCLYHCMCS